MSGEFGSEFYRGFIHDAIYQLGTECRATSNLYDSTRAFGDWLQRHVFVVAKNVAYNEACDDSPCDYQIRNIELMRDAIEDILIAWKNDIRRKEIEEKMYRNECLNSDDLAWIAANSKPADGTAEQGGA